MIQTIQSALVDQLKGQLGGGYRVEPFPDRPQERLLTGGKGSIFIRYGGAKHINPIELGGTALQADFPLQREYRFEVFIAVSGLNGSEGALSLLERVIEALSGFQPTGCTPLLPKEDGFTTRMQNLWVYAAQFTLTD